MARKVAAASHHPRSTIAWFAIGCGATLALGLTALAIVLTLVTSAPPPLPEAHPSGQAPSMEGAPPLEQQLRQAERAVHSGRSAAVRMAVRDDELNALIADNPPPDLRNLRVYFGSGSIAATGDATWRGRTIPVTVRATPVIESGQVRLQVQEVLLGRLPAPEAIRAQVRDRLQRGLSELTGQYNVTVTSVSVAPGVLTVTGTVGER